MTVNIEDLDCIEEETCHYCGDLNHSAHRCRAGNHDFRPNGKHYVVLTKEELIGLLEQGVAQ